MRNLHALLCIIQFFRLSVMKEDIFDFYCSHPGSVLFLFSSTISRQSTYQYVPEKRRNSIASFRMIGFTSGRQRRSSWLPAAAGTVLLLLLAFAVPLEAQKPAVCDIDGSYCVCQRFDTAGTCPEPPRM